MGGIISITFRLPDGTEYRTQRWTNRFPYWLNNSKLLNKDLAHIHEYLAGWLEMKADYESGQNKLPYTHIFFPSPGLVPVEYGILVIDLQQNEILDCFNNYAFLGQVYVSQFQVTRYWDDEPDTVDRIDQLLQHKKVLRMEYGNGKYITPSANLQSLLETLRVCGEVILWLDMAPFTLTRYKWSEGQTAVAHIKRLGFTLSEQEEQGWQDWIKEREENQS